MISSNRTSLFFCGIGFFAVALLVFAFSTLNRVWTGAATTDISAMRLRGSDPAVDSAEGSLFERTLSDIELETAFASGTEEGATAASTPLVFDAASDPSTTFGLDPALQRERNAASKLFETLFSNMSRPSCAMGSADAIRHDDATATFLMDVTLRKFFLIIPKEFFTQSLVRWMANNFCSCSAHLRKSSSSDKSSPPPPPSWSVLFELTAAPAQLVERATTEGPKRYGIHRSRWVNSFWEQVHSSPQNAAAVGRLRFLQFLVRQQTLAERSAVTAAAAAAAGSSDGEEGEGMVPKLLIGFVPDPISADFATAVARARRNVQRRQSGDDRIEKPYRVEENNTFLVFGRGGIRTVPKGCCGAFISPKLLVGSSRVQSSPSSFPTAAPSNLASPPQLPPTDADGADPASLDRLFREAARALFSALFRPDASEYQILFSLDKGAVSMNHFVASEADHRAMLSGDAGGEEARLAKMNSLLRVGPREMRWAPQHVANSSNSRSGLKRILRRPFLGVGPKSSVFSSFHRASALRFSKKYLCPPSARVAIHVPLFWPRCVYTSDSTTSSPSSSSREGPSVPPQLVRGLSCPRLDIFLQQIDGFNTIRYEVDLYIHVHRERLQFLPRQYRGEILRRFNRGAVYFVDHHWGEHPWYLAWKPRTLMRNSVGLYDLFFYTEDDIGVTGKTFDYFCDNHFRVQRVSQTTVLGTIRYEKVNGGQLYPTDRDELFTHDIVWTAAKKKRDAQPSNNNNNEDIHRDQKSSQNSQNRVPYYLLEGVAYSPFWWATGSDLVLASRSRVWHADHMNPRRCDYREVLAAEQRQLVQRASAQARRDSGSSSTTTTTFEATPTTTSIIPDLATTTEAPIASSRSHRASRASHLKHEIQQQQQQQQRLQRRPVGYDNFQRPPPPPCDSGGVSVMTREEAAYFKSPGRILRSDTITDTLIPMDLSAGCVAQSALVEHIGVHDAYWTVNGRRKKKLWAGVCVPKAQFTPAPLMRSHTYKEQQRRQRNAQFNKRYAAKSIFGSRFDSSETSKFARSLLYTLGTAGLVVPIVCCVAVACSRFWKWWRNTEDKSQPMLELQKQKQVSLELQRRAYEREREIVAHQRQDEDSELEADGIGDDARDESRMICALVSASERQ